MQKEYLVIKLLNEKMKKKILHLTLTRHWFNQIALGLKKKEYRKMTEYWRKRLTMCSYHRILKPKRFDEVHFRNGYTLDRPFMRVEWKGLEIENFNYDVCYAILLGKILEIKNWVKE